jgi:hypothetical protein
MKRAALIVSLLLLYVSGCSSKAPMAGPTPVPAGGSGTAAGISWTQFEDPAEQAFTMQVPRGWKVVGGAYRFGPLDPRAMVDMTSPDGKTNLRFGDANVPPFATLTSTMRALGWQEGRQYSPRGVAKEVVANYRPGWVFADLYGQSRFSHSCQNLKLKQMKEVDPIHPNPQERVTAGEVLYTCDTSAGPKAAYVFAETSLTQMGMAGAWLVTWLYSFITPIDQAPETMKTILHSLATFEINPQWEAQQLRLNGQEGQGAYTQYQQTMAQEHARFERQSAQFQHQTDEMSRALRGVDLTVDSVDGTQREVWVGTGGTHWMTPMGDIVNSPTSPTPGSHVLRTVQ